MMYAEVEDHLRSAYLACAKALNALRDSGLPEDMAPVEDCLLDFEFRAWEMLDRMRT